MTLSEADTSVIYIYPQASTWHTASLGNESIYIKTETSKSQRQITLNSDHKGPWFWCFSSMQRKHQMQCSVLGQRPYHAHSSISTTSFIAKEAE